MATVMTLVMLVKVMSSVILTTLKTKIITHMTQLFVCMVCNFNCFMISLVCGHLQNAAILSGTVAFLALTTSPFYKVKLLKDWVRAEVSGFA